MKIAYIARWDIGRESGVLKKIASQMRVWINEGNEVSLFVLSRDDKIWEGMGDLPVDIVPCGKILTRFFEAELLVKRVLTWKPDAAYLRFGTYYPSLEVLMASTPTVLEINTDDVAEGRLTLSKCGYLYHRVTRERILRAACGMVFVTREIVDRFSQYEKPSLVVGNGIDLFQYPQLPAPKNPNPRLVFMGSPGALWHGVDKILWLAPHFVQWQFDLIGVGPADLNVELPPNVSAHGPLNRAQYKELMARADAAIGTLALHRKQMNEASPLKVREYLAYGLPTIIGYRDTDFPRPVPYLLQLPNTPSNVVDHVPMIEQFVEAWRGKRVNRKEIAHLDLGLKERERISFFHRVLRMPEDQ